MAEWTPDPTFVIRTPRLTITHFFSTSPSHCQLLLDIFSHAKYLAQFSSAFSCATLEDTRAFITGRVYQHQAKEGYGHFLVSNESKPIGIVSLVRSRDCDPRLWLPAPDIGFALLEEETGKGYATEAANALIEYARERWGVAEVLGVTHPENVKSRRTMERIKMVFLEERELEMFGGQVGAVYSTETNN
ncbi:acyl-CoA N-acyltransferase [Hymenopellis radicata]|nr:acyl-CoA N-acyltransferase [Hymenopellis radicata]